MGYFKLLKKALKIKNLYFDTKTLKNVRPVLEWYHHYLNHPGGDRLANTLLQVCYWKGLTAQAKKLAKHCPVCQKFKKRNNKYGKLPPKDVDKLIPWHTVHIDLIGPYTVSTKQHTPGGEIIDVELQLT